MPLAVHMRSNRQNAKILIHTKLKSVIRVWGQSMGSAGIKTRRDMIIENGSRATSPSHIGPLRSNGCFFLPTEEEYGRCLGVLSHPPLMELIEADRDEGNWVTAH